MTIGEKMVSCLWELTSRATKAYKGESSKDDKATQGDKGQRSKGNKTTKGSKGARIVKGDKTSKGSKSKPIKKQPAGKAIGSKYG